MTDRVAPHSPEDGIAQLRELVAVWQRRAELNMQQTTAKQALEIARCADELESALSALIEPQRTTEKS